MMIKKKPFFSIITITLSNIDGLKRTHASIASQTNTDYEWIVIDGASTDGTKEFLQSTNAHITSEPDKGIYDAMNKGIDQATGKYLLFLNAGDALATPDILQTIKAQSNNEDFIYGDSIEKNYYKKARSHAHIKHHMFTHHQAMLYNRKSIGALRYDQHYKIAADYDFTAKFLQKNKGALYISKPICIFEPGGISQTNARQGRMEQFQIRRNLRLTRRPLNIIIYIIQRLLWNIRSFFKPLYWWWKTKN